MSNNSPNVDIAVGRPELLEEYRTVFLDCVLFDRYFADDDRLRIILAAALEKKELLEARVGGELAGVMEVRLNGFFEAFPYLSLLGVKKGWRKMGVGRQMLAFYEEMARQSGYKRVSLMVSAFNPRAKNLYQSLGYKRVGFLPSAFKEGNDENIMVKDL